MPFFAVHYTYSAATVPARDEARPTHRAWLSGLVEQGVVRTSGPYVDGSGALIIVEADDADAAQRVLADDPFAKAGLVDAVRIQEWTQVFGAFA